MPLVSRTAADGGRRLNQKRRRVCAILRLYHLDKMTASTNERASRSRKISTTPNRFSPAALDRHTSGIILSSLQTALVTARLHGSETMKASDMHPDLLSVYENVEDAEFLPGSSDYTINKKGQLVYCDHE